MSDSVNVKVLDQMYCIHLNISVWSARKKLTVQDLGAQAELLPPDQLASLGSKRMCDPVKIAVFTNLRKRATVVLDRVGVRFLGGWAVPSDTIDDVFRDLATLRDEFMDEKASFMASYETDIQDWISQFPAWDTVLQNSIVDPGYVSSRLSFGWQAFQVVTDQDSVHADGGLVDATSQLGNSLFEEVASMAKSISLTSFLGKSETSQKVLNGFSRIHKKLTGLAFLDPKAYPIAEVVQTSLARMPRKGKISGLDFFTLNGILGLLQDARGIEAYATARLAGTTSSSSYLDELVSCCPSSKATILEEPTAKPVPEVIATTHASSQTTSHDEELVVLEESPCEVIVEAIVPLQNTEQGELRAAAHVATHESVSTMDDANISMEPKESREEFISQGLGRPMPQFDSLDLGLW